MKKIRHIGSRGNREFQPRVPKFCATCRATVVAVRGTCPKCKGRV